jgi:hypothetical protein
MGSFYSSCSITGVTLSHQKVAKILLLPYNYLKAHNTDSRDIFKNKKGVIISADDSAMFVPFGLPIYGEYSDCGQLDNIVKNAIVLQLEEFFDLSIEQIITAASRDRWEEELSIKYMKGRKEDKDRIEKYELLQLMTCTDVHYGIYEYLTNIKYLEQDIFFSRLNNRIQKTIDHAGVTPDVNNPHAFVEHMRLSEDGVFRYSSFPYYRYDFLGSIVDATEFRRLIYFLENIWKLNRMLLPSQYGDQEDNFEMITELNKVTNKILTKDKKYFEG